MSSNRLPSRGAVGGAANEAGAEYRRGVAAYFVAHGLNGIPVQGLPVAGGDAIVEAVALESDFPVDDILVVLRGGRAFLQAKRDLAWGVIPAVVEQWIAAARHAEFDATRDILVAVAGSLTARVESAALALRRGREGGTSYSAQEAEAIARLREALKAGGASAEEIARIIARAVILHLQVENIGEADATAGYLLLDGHVVAKGEGAHAWREILSLAGDAARLRLGHTVETWLRHLRQRGVPLVADANASRAGYLMAQSNAVARYRDLLTRRGREVDLSALGISLPPIAFDNMDAGISFNRRGEDRDSYDPLWTFRRHGRIILTGLPGSGKSTVVANIAGEWAFRGDWSVPIVASLRRLGAKERFRQQPLRDQIVEMAVAPLDPADRELVTEALHDALRTGQAALFFDGLDEAADRSLLLVSDISELLESVHPDTDVLVATRDVAYSDTQRLGFADFQVGAPIDVSRAIAAVLRSVAVMRNIDGMDDWVAAREKWVSHALDNDRELRETPLFPVLLAFLAAERNVDSLPGTRTEILEQVVRDVVERRETTREIIVPGIDHASYSGVLLGAFPLIANALSVAGGSAPRALVADAVAEYLRDHWGLPTGPAASAALRVLLFWDDAGVFVASGADKLVSPRLQLLLEIGVALHVSGLSPAEAVDWVRVASGRPDTYEALGLAAGKSTVVADALVECATELDDDRLVTVAARAMSHGARASDSAYRKLLLKIRERIASGGDAGWQCFRMVSALSIPVDLQEPILSDIDASYPTPYAAIARAHGCLSWGWQVDRLEGYLETALLYERPHLAAKPGRIADLSHAAYENVEMRVLETAVSRLLPSRPDLAPAAASAMGRATMRTGMAIADSLRANGHADLAASTLDQWMGTTRRFSDGARETAAKMDELLSLISSLSTPAELSSPQQRRLAEFASFIQTLDLNSLDAWPRTKDLAADWPDFVADVAILGGFDCGVLAAQAAIVRTEIGEDPSGTRRPFWSLIDLHTAAQLVHWADLADPAATKDRFLKVLRTGGNAARAVAAGALARHPDRAGTAIAVKMILEHGPAAASLYAMWAYLELVEDAATAATHWGASPRPSVREAVARIVPAVRGGAITSLAQQLIADRVRQVRLGVLRHLEVADDELPYADSLLKTAAEAADPAFDCAWCGTHNPSAADSCNSCHLVTDRPSKVARRLLERLRGTSSEHPVDAPH